MYDSGIDMVWVLVHEKWMMLGELAGVALVAITAVIGIAAVMVQISLVVSC